MKRHCCPLEVSKPSLDRAGSAGQVKPGMVSGKPGGTSNEGRAQSRESTEGNPTKQQEGRRPTLRPPATEIRGTAEDSLQVCLGAHSVDPSLLRTLAQNLRAGKQTHFPLC